MRRQASMMAGENIQQFMLKYSSEPSEARVSSGGFSISSVRKPLESKRATANLATRSAGMLPSAIIAEREKPARPGPSSARSATSAATG